MKYMIDPLSTTKRDFENELSRLLCNELRIERGFAHELAERVSRLVHMYENVLVDQNRYYQKQLFDKLLMEPHRPIFIPADKCECVGLLTPNSSETCTWCGGSPIGRCATEAQIW